MMTESEIKEQLQVEWDTTVDFSDEERTAFVHGKLPGPVAIYALLEDVRMRMQSLRASGLMGKYADRFVTSGWTLKDLLSHLASWAFELRREVQTISEGRSFDYIIPWALSLIGPNEWNKEEVEQRRSQSWEQAVEEFDSEIKQIQDLILMMPLEILNSANDFPHAPAGVASARWRGPMAQMAVGMTMHYRYHIERVHRWIMSVRNV